MLSFLFERSHLNKAAARLVERLDYLSDTATTELRTQQAISKELLTELTHVRKELRARRKQGWLLEVSIPLAALAFTWLQVHVSNTQERVARETGAAQVASELSNAWRETFS